MCERGVLSEFRAARARASYWFDKSEATVASGVGPILSRVARAEISDIRVYSKRMIISLVLLLVLQRQTSTVDNLMLLGSARLSRRFARRNQANLMRTAHCIVKPARRAKTALRLHCARPYGTLHTSEAPCPNVQPRLVKPARLHFARTARALRDATYERGVLSEFRAARTCASYWFDKAAPRVVLVV